MHCIINAMFSLKCHFLFEFDASQSYAFLILLFKKEESIPMRCAFLIPKTEIKMAYLRNSLILMVKSIFHYAQKMRPFNLYRFKRNKNVDKNASVMLH